jgi:aspartate racemase
MREKVIGILGGMGPRSTADCFLKIIEATPANKEQDHLRIIIDNNPKIPDRTLAILKKGRSPLAELEKTIRNLEKAGAEVIAIPCSTAHYYYHELQKSTNIPIINMIFETVEYTCRSFPNAKKMGLLATTGTIRAGIYHELIIRKGREIIVPDGVAQRRVMNAIYGGRGIKAGYTQGEHRKDLSRVAQALIEQGAEAVIAGCTEITLVLDQGDLPVPLIDPLQILAEVVVKKARVVNGI